MSSFTEEPILSPLPDGKHWVVRKAFRYYIGEEGSGEYVDVPVGFITDFGSIPRFFWRIYPPWGKYGKATIVHDWICWKQQYSRKRGDEIFHEAMLVSDVIDRDARIIYYAVRTFGGKAWKNNQKKKASEKFATLTGEFEKIERIAA